MQFRTLFTIMMGTLILFFIGCGEDELDDSSATRTPEPVGSITGKVTNIPNEEIAPPNGEIPLEITFPKPNDKVGWRTRITGKLLGAKDLKELEASLNLNKDEELKIRLWVWDPNDPHGPWLQPPATIQDDLKWVEDEPAWFGREGNIDVGKKFNVKAELVKNEDLRIDEVDPVTITNVIRK